MKRYRLSWWAGLFGLPLLGVVGTEPCLGQTDPSGAWRTWHTVHFRVHAKVEDSAVALKAALEAERAFALLSQELVPPRGRIDLVLAGNLDVPNAFASFFPSSRVTVYLTPPAGDPVLGNYDDWLRLALIHELTHVFHLDRSRGVWRLPQYLFGRWPAWFPHAYRPSWVAEGLATYYESHLTRAGRLRGGLHAQLLAAAALDRWPDANDATLVSPKWPAGFRPYAWGSYFFQLQAARGDSVVPRFVERTARRLWPFTLSGPLRDAGGWGVKQAWGELEQRWRDTVGQLAATAVRPPQRILARGLRSLPRPRVSGDGRYLAYLHADGVSEPRIVLLERASRRVLGTKRITGGADLAWQDSTLWVSQLEFTSPVEIRSQLYRWQPGGRWERVPNSDRLSRPFALDQGRVGAVDLRSGAARLVVLDPGAGTAPDNLPAPEADGWGYVAASPGGSWVAGARHLGGQWDLVLWRREDPNQVVRITADPALDDDPAWSAEGDLLVFTSERLGLPQIFAYRLNGGALIQVTAEPTGARDPALAEGGSLYFATVLPDGFALIEQVGLTQREVVASRADTFSNRPLLERVEVQRSGYDPWPSLRPHYWIPTWHDAGLAGRFVGISSGGADAIGRTAYAVQLAVAPGKEGRLEAQGGLVHRRWKAWALSASGTQSWEEVRTRLLVSGTGGTVDTAPAVLGRRERDAELAASASFRRWRTVLTGRGGVQFEEDFLTLDSSRAGLRLRDPLTRSAGGALGLSISHFQRPPLSLSPENGIAASVVYRRLYELAPLLDPTSRRWSEEIRGVLAGYLALPLPGFAHWVLAVRASGGLSRGPLVRRFEIGGVSGERLELFPGYVVGAGRRSFPLRGYPPGGFFSRVFTGALELRVPVALLAQGLWELPVGVDRISSTFFAEAGGGWRAGESARPLALRDAGVEAVFDLAVPYDVPLRLRLGTAVVLSGGLGQSPGDLRFYTAFGSAF